ncbi:MAG: radical SAM protein [Ruminococcaceae bacterium]|nr:radical SAM protein [Oscillospiraceae bacterium]
MQGPAYKMMRERLVKAAKAKRVPVLGHYELTARCNLNCKMCYVHTQDHSAAMKKELSTEQWKHIFDEACACEMQYATLSGGECLLRKDFRELYLHLWNKNVLITVMTNATLLDAEYVEFFKTYPPELVQISLYGSCEEGYLSLTGHKGFQKATTAVLALQDAGINVRAVATPSRYMTDDYIETVRVSKEMGINFTMSDMNLTRNRENPDQDDYFLTVDEIVDLMVRRSELSKKLVPVDSTPEPWGCMCEEPAVGLTCNAGNCLATVTFDGRMYPCSNAIIGDGYSVLELGYAGAWEKTKAVADAVKYGIECVGCPYDKLCSKCPTFRLKDLHSGHCNPDMCERTRKLVAAGVKKLNKE